MQTIQTIKSTAESLKYGQFVSIKTNDDTYNRVFRGISRVRLSAGNFIEVIHINAYEADPRKPEYAKENFFGFLLSSVVEIKTSAAMDSDIRDIGMQRALINTNKVLSRINLNELMKQGE